METEDLPGTKDDLATLRFQLQEERAELNQSLELELAKRQRYAKENERRKHNFIPLIVNLLTLLAEKGTLLPAMEKSKEKPEGSKKK